MPQVQTSDGTTPVNPATPVIPSQRSEQIDLLVSLHLWSWPALHLSVQNSWGGSAQLSSDKRDWFAGAVSELITSSPPQIQDVDDLEEVLLQVMVDEFEVVVDDGSAEELARKIWDGLKRIDAGDLSEIQRLFTAWQEQQKKGRLQIVGIVRGEDRDGQDTDWDEDDDGNDEEWNGFSNDNEETDDTHMVDASPPPKSTMLGRSEPEVDEDGFTKVTGKKRR